jgi:hypothetical protein
MPLLGPSLRHQVDKSFWERPLQLRKLHYAICVIPQPHQLLREAAAVWDSPDLTSQDK